MSAVIEPSGAQLLPRVADERATTSAWAAHCATDADLRARSKPHRDLAAGLRAVPAPKPHGCGWCGEPVLMPYDGEHAYTARSLDGSAHHCGGPSGSAPALFELGELRVAPEPCAAAAGTCGRRAVHAATFQACEHRVPLCDRDAASMHARAEVGGTRCPSCGTKGATTWAPIGATS